MMNSLFVLAQTAVAENSARPGPPRTEHVGSYWFPESASTFAKNIDSLYMLIFWVSLVFFAAIIGAMIYFVIKYRARPGHKVEKSPSHNTALEIAWSVLPGFLLIWFFIDGANGYFDQRVTPGDAEQIKVVASQFNWQFIYPNGDISPELHLVQNRPVEFVMESRDVLHSFFVPAFRQKQDIVPGRYTYCWVKPTKTGVFRVYCTEYCGDEHSLMKTNCTVHDNVEARDKATFWDWPGKTPFENGERLFAMQCSGCHATTEVKKTGPGLANLWGTMEVLNDGTTVKFDDNYFKESLENPSAKIVEGFNYPSQMTNFSGKLTPDQILWLNTYVRSFTPGVGEPPREIPEGEAKKGDAPQGEGEAKGEQPPAEEAKKAAPDEQPEAAAKKG